MYKHVFIESFEEEWDLVGCTQLKKNRAHAS